MPPLFGRQRTEWLLRVSCLSSAPPGICEEGLWGLPRELLPFTVFSLGLKGIPYLKKSQAALTLWEILIGLGGGEGCGGALPGESAWPLYSYQS